MVNCNQGSFNGGIMTYEDAMKKVQELVAERDALAGKLARSEDYCIGVDSERMDYIVKHKELAAERDALTAENAALKGALNKISFTYPLSPHIHEMTVVETPATDAAIAEWKAQGADAVASYHAEHEEFFKQSRREAYQRHLEARLCAIDVAASLRKGVQHDR